MKHWSTRGRLTGIIGAAALTAALVVGSAAAAQASTGSGGSTETQYTPDGRPIAGTISPANSTPVSASEAKKLEAIRLGQVATPLTTHPACAGRTDFYQVVHADNSGFHTDCFANSGTYSYTMYGGRYLCPGVNVP